MIPADEGAEVEKGAVHRHQPLVAGREAPMASDPGEGALDDPAVTTEPMLRFDALAGDPMLDPAAAGTATVRGSSPDRVEFAAMLEMLTV